MTNTEEMGTNSRFLVAIDTSEASMRSVSYVATIVSGRKDIDICLFHVPTPFTAQLREVPWTDFPEKQAAAQAELQAAQARWIEHEERAAQPVFTQAKSILREQGIPDQAIEMRFGSYFRTQTVADEILEAARQYQYSTIVVGRESFSEFKELFMHHVGDTLIRKGQGLTVWIVE